MNGRNEKAYNLRGTILSNLGNKNEALINFNQAIQINPNDAVAYNNRGYNY